MLQSVSPIRDIIHDYIALSDFEAEIVDSRYFQRLHFVWQNSAAFAVYPCNKNSRFVHTLGVSHLCGRIFIHSLRNSNKDVLLDFLVQSDKFVKEFMDAVGQNLTEALVSSWQESVGNRSRFRHNDLSMKQIRDFCDEEISPNKKKRVSSDPEFLVNTLWLALKIAALCHDIGHLPMSHEFEKAFADLPDACELFGIPDEAERDKFRNLLRSKTSINWEDCFSNAATFTAKGSAEVYSKVLGISLNTLKGYLAGLELHERRSVRIIDELRVRFGSPSTSLHKDYRSLLFRLATAILLYDRNLNSTNAKSKSSFLRALKDILASQLDADRLDYVARDPKSSGLETGIFDLNRIVSSFQLAKLDGHFVAAPGERALTAIEAFFHQRYLNYKSLIYHKSALRSKAVLRQAIVRILAFSIRQPNNPIADMCERAGMISIARGGEVDAVLPFDSRNLEQFDDAKLRSFFFDVLNELEAGQCLKNLRDGEEALLKSIELLLKTFLFREKQNLTSLNYEYEAFSRLENYPKSGIETAVKSLSLELQRKHSGKVVPLISSREPKVYRAGKSRSSTLYVVGKTGALRPVEELSPYLKSQSAMVHDEPQFHIGFCSLELRSPENAKLRDELQKQAKKIFDSLLKEVTPRSPKKPSKVRKRQTVKEAS